MGECECGRDGRLVLVSDVCGSPACQQRRTSCISHGVDEHTVRV